LAEEQQGVARKNGYANSSSADQGACTIEQQVVNIRHPAWNDELQ
jgi:hypothetical protein